MAEPKGKSAPKPKPKPKPPVNVENETIDLILLLLLAGAIAGSLVPLIMQLIMGISFWDALKNILLTIYTYYRFIATLICVLLATGIAYCTVRLNQIRAEEAKIYEAGPDDGPAGTPEGAMKKHRNDKWQRVEQLVGSENPSDWRLAIIEADILLDEMLSRMPYPGETISDKLKGIEKSDFTTIESAWEAHKARNQIVHAGSDFVLTEREARRIVNLYREVFEEFYFI